MDKAWKAFERRIAKRVGGKRIPVTGERDAADVIVDGAFSYQCKLRRGLPSYLRDWLRGIVSAGERSGATGVVIWKQPNARDDDAVVVLRLKDWQDWHGCDTRQIKRLAGSEPGEPFDSVHGQYPGNGDINDLEHTAPLDPSATGYLVNPPKEIHDGNRNLK